MIAFVSSFGPLKAFNMVKDGNGMSKGYCFFKYSNPAVTQTAVVTVLFDRSRQCLLMISACVQDGLNGLEIKGMKCVCQLSGAPKGPGNGGVMGAASAMFGLPGMVCKTPILLFEIYP